MSKPIILTYGRLAQLVRASALQAEGHRFESYIAHHAEIAQLVEQRTENPRVVGSIPTGGTIFHSRLWNRRNSLPTVSAAAPFLGPRCGCSSSGRAPPCQGGGSGFEPRHPLQTDKERAEAFLISYGTVAKW